MIKEYKEFAMRGNVLDMAVGIIIGASFGSVVRSLVDDVIMPPGWPPSRECRLLKPFYHTARG